MATSAPMTSFTVDREAALTEQKLEVHHGSPCRCWADGTAESHRRAVLRDLIVRMRSEATENCAAWVGGRAEVLQLAASAGAGGETVDAAAATARVLAKGISKVAAGIPGAVKGGR